MVAFGVRPKKVPFCSISEVPRTSCTAVFVLCTGAFYRPCSNPSSQISAIKMPYLFMSEFFLISIPYSALRFDKIVDAVPGGSRMALAQVAERSGLRGLPISHVTIPNP